MSDTIDTFLDEYLRNVKKDTEKHGSNFKYDIFNPLTYSAQNIDELLGMNSCISI